MYCWGVLRTWKEFTNDTGARKVRFQSSFPLLPSTNHQSSKPPPFYPPSNPSPSLTSTGCAHAASQLLHSSKLIAHVTHTPLLEGTQAMLNREKTRVGFQGFQGPGLREIHRNSQDPIDDTRKQPRPCVPGRQLCTVSGTHEMSDFNRFSPSIHEFYQC